ncbi:TetR/AcrR family transcriptional regulator [Agromyces humatus]|uniref:TetR family transcriptional regulator n=1 Tax=Agromyces humatus TaxID=279573 RepID=A0ABP4WTN3_9MICO|nr:TetR family transcriptional regulator [Agromyces humatus]
MPRPFAPERREEVLDQAVAFLAENGLANFSTRKLATAIGASTNVIFYQFGSKENLIAAALERARSENLRVLEGFRTATPDASVADAFEGIWVWWMEEPSRLTYSRLNMEAMTTGVGDDAARTDLIDYWVDYFGGWLVRDGHSEARAPQLATLLLATLSGLTIDLIATGDRARLDASVADFAAYLRAT